MQLSPLFKINRLHTVQVFPITVLQSDGGDPFLLGQVGDEHRISRLIPGMNQKRILFPGSLCLLLLCFLLALDLGEELVEFLLAIGGHQRIDLDEVRGDFA